MPEMDGFEATRKIKALRPRLPIIAQTAYSLNQDREKAIQAGCCDFISKPINKVLFEEVVKKHLGIKG